MTMAEYIAEAEEIDRREYDPVSKLKALEEAKGDEQVAKAIYAKHRVRRLKDLAAEYELIQAGEKMEEEKRRKKKAEKGILKSDSREQSWLKNIDTEAIRKRTKI
tara:strand:+ start:301 stop:615 length:315 start_codon:yes stop_codon:yes gene_type:complete